jgi:hypothetical protein
VQVDSIKPTLKAPGTKPFTLTHYCFSFNLRRYIPGDWIAAAAAAAEDPCGGEARLRNALRYRAGRRRHRPLCV